MFLTNGSQGALDTSIVGKKGLDERFEGLFNMVFEGFRDFAFFE